MMKKIKKLFVVLALLTISVFALYDSASAEDSIKVKNVIAGNGINYRTTSDGVAAYSFGSKNMGPKKGDKLVLNKTYNNGYYLYILNDTKIAGTDPVKARTIRQKALWKIRGFKIIGAYVNEATSLYKAALKNGEKYEVVPSFSSVSSPGYLSKNGEYYFSNKIFVKMNNTVNDNYRVIFMNEPKGTQVINQTKTSFQIRVPESSVEKEMSFKVKVVAPLSPYKYVKRYHKDDNTDDLLVLNESFKSPSVMLNVGIKPNVVQDNTNNTSNNSNSTGKYNVTLYIVSGKNHNVVEVKAGEKMTKPITPVRTGYIFKGWYTDDTYKNAYDFDKPVNSNIELYAKWELATYTISYDSNGGTSVASAKVQYNEQLEKPEDPVKSGYYFAGWYKDKELKNKFSFFSSISKDTKLYAKWSLEKPTTHDVTFIPGFSIEPVVIEVEDGKTVEAPVVTNDESDNLAGWYTDESKQVEYDFNTPVTKDFALYAKWLSATGEEIIEAPDTASPASIAIIVGGLALLAGGAYIITKQYGIDIFRR